MTAPLLLSGLPGSGKSYFAEWLEERGWARIEYDTSYGSSPGLWNAWLAALGGDDAALVGAAGRSSGTVIEWGFDPIVSLSDIKLLIGRGYNAWYFDGDREVARLRWLARRGPSDLAWRVQVAKLDLVADNIRAIYGRKIIRTVEAGPRPYVPPQEIYRLLGLV